MGSINSSVNLLDCTLRDGGYYNDWDFDHELINAYLKAMVALPVDMVEIGFRFIPGNCGKFRGGCAYATDDFIDTLEIPSHLRLAVMVNGAELVNYPDGVCQAVDILFGPAISSPVEMVRVAVHVNRVIETLPAITRLHELGYKVTINLMQIAGLDKQEVEALARLCSTYPIDILYFADSLGSMIQNDIDQTVDAIRIHWKGELGFHAHNNMEWGLANCVRAMELGVTWIDSTVLGMGRGPGNVRTEYLAIEMESKLKRKMNYTPLLDLVSKYFEPMHHYYGWGANPYYYIAGKFGIHPTYVQTMLADNRYDSDEVLTVLNEIKKSGGKYYSPGSLELARKFYEKSPQGRWNPEDLFKDKIILIIGSGSNLHKYCKAIESYIKRVNPVVVVLNKQSPIKENLINVRAACRPLRILADAEDYNKFSQPLICPASMLPDEIAKILSHKIIYDYGIVIKKNCLEVYEDYCVIPYSLVIAYVLAIAIRGKASKILLAGFEGYSADDSRMREMEDIFSLYLKNENAQQIFTVTPSKYTIESDSIFNPLI